MDKNHHAEPRDEEETGADAVFLTGKFSGNDVLNLVQVLGEAQRTGQLSCEVEGHSKRIFFLSGRIVSASSTDLRESLGRYLVCRGACADEQIDRALKYQRKKGILLGGALIDLGVITKSQLGRALAGKTEEIVFGLFDCCSGDVVFEPALVSPDHLHYTVSLTVGDVLWRGEARREKLAEISVSLSDMPFRLTEEASFGAETGAFTRKLLQLVDGKLDLAGLVRASGVPAYWTCVETSHLLEKGWISIDRERLEASPDSASALRP